MCASLFDKVLSQFALREQSVCCDGSALDLNGVQHWGSRFDFIGLLCFVTAFDRQGAYFFCV